MLRICFTYLVVAALPLLANMRSEVHGCAVDEQAIVERIDDDLDQLVKRRNPDARTRLSNAPREIVVPRLIQRLKDDPAFEAEWARRSAYHLLMTHQAALTAAGFEQLLVGVHDPFGRSASLSALGLTPEERFSDLVNGILPLLLEGEVLEHDLRRVMELLGRARGQAVAALEAITEVYFDSDRESDTRMVAAQTMVLIGGVLWAVEQFGVKDLASCSPFQATAIVEAIAHGGSVTEGTFDIEPSLRAIPRVLLITAVRHESPAVREAAVWALLVAHSEDEAVIKNAQGEYQVNPDLRRVLHTLMREDPDPDLRVMAAQTVHELFPMWIDRRRQRDEEQGRQNDAGNE